MAQRSVNTERFDRAGATYAVGLSLGIIGGHVAYVVRALREIDQATPPFGQVAKELRINYLSLPHFEYLTYGIIIGLLAGFVWSATHLKLPWPRFPMPGPDRMSRRAANVANSKTWQPREEPSLGSLARARRGLTLIYYAAWCVFAACSIWGLSLVTRVIRSRLTGGGFPAAEAAPVWARGYWALMVVGVVLCVIGRLLLIWSRSTLPAKWFVVAAVGCDVVAATVYASVMPDTTRFVLSALFTLSALSLFLAFLKRASAYLGDAVSEARASNVGRCFLAAAVVLGAILICPVLLPKISLGSFHVWTNWSLIAAWILGFAGLILYVRTLGSFRATLRTREHNFKRGQRFGKRTVDA